MLTGCSVPENREKQQDRSRETVRARDPRDLKDLAPDLGNEVAPIDFAAFAKCLGEVITQSRQPPHRRR
jgi:hypothetical protein